MGWICWGQAESLGRLPPGQSEILEYEIILFHVYLKVLHVHQKLINMLPSLKGPQQSKTMNLKKFGSRQTDCQCRHISDPSGQQCRRDQGLIRALTFAIVSAYFEPYLYMLKVHCLITAIFTWESARLLITRCWLRVQFSPGAWCCVPQQGTYSSGLVMVKPRKLS